MFSNSFRLPSKGVLYGLFALPINALVNSVLFARVRRAIFSRLPFITLESDVVDVVYANWVVPVSAVQGLLPAKLRLVEVDGKTILTTLTYRHGHFGPCFVGPLRMLFPSPLQSNWRLYLDRSSDPRGATSAVLFIKNIFDSAAYAIGSRLFSDALPSHAAHSFMHAKTQGGYRTEIDGGAGSAPSFDLEVSTTDQTILPSEFNPDFPLGRGSVARQVASKV
jgi:hypothetical protein